jgi:peptidoglycan hydrolase CwlO-like protein
MSLIKLLFFNRLEKEKNALTQEADELAESNEKLQKAKAVLEKNNRSMDAELSENKSAVSHVVETF